jgi:membrane associated rhomboid family serine protease
MTDSQPWGRPHPAGVLTAVAVCLLTLLIPLIPDAGETLQWQRSGSIVHHSFDWLTGHLTHWSADHLIWDLVTFVALSFGALRLIPRRYLLCLFLAALLIPLEIALNQSHLDSYRGLSGIDSALFGLILAGLWRTSANAGRFHPARLLSILGAVGFLAKNLFEFGTGQTVFVSGTSAGFIPAVSAHLVGIICGLASGLIRRPGPV